MSLKIGFGVSFVSTSFGLGFGLSFGIKLKFRFSISLKGKMKKYKQTFDSIWKDLAQLIYPFLQNQVEENLRIWIVQKTSLKCEDNLKDLLAEDLERIRL